MLRGICYVYEGGKMYLEPKNRNLLVLPLEEEQDSNSIIVLPEDYKQPESPYVCCDVLGISKDCSIDIDIGDRIVVERRMLYEVKALGETNYLVLENYVYGRLQDE
jgi:co-chaperonin GroES (HSP10)